MKTESQITESLYHELVSKTQEVKAEYITMTKDWADRQFDTVIARKGWKEVDWCNYMGVTPEAHNAGTSSQFYGFPRGFYNTKAARKLDSLKSQLSSYIRIGKAEFIAKEVNAAEKHYEAATMKLAGRLAIKAAEAGFEVTTARVGVNLEITIKHGETFTKAWTIIAGGAVQRDHYRYLVK